MVTAALQHRKRRYHDTGDQLRAWADRCKPTATRYGNDYEVVREVLDRVPDVLDVDKSHEEADPYVLAMALERKRAGDETAVVNEERKDTPAKRSMTTACGDLWLVALPMSSLLARKGIWPRNTK